jgi:PBP1b-binding outer membrane lipoprotein LpoB
MKKSITFLCLLSILLSGCSVEKNDKVSLDIKPMASAVAVKKMPVKAKDCEIVLKSRVFVDDEGSSEQYDKKDYDKYKNSIRKFSIPVAYTKC